MPHKLSSEEADKIHKQGMKRFELAEKYDREQRRLSIEDTRFAHTEEGQWNNDDVQRRRNRPRYTFNRVIGVIKQITGAHKQSRSQIKVTPKSGGADTKTANIFAGIIKNIETESNAYQAYDNSFDEKVAGGYGAWRILTEFKEDSFDQEIVIRRVKSAATSHYIALPFEEYTGSDAPAQFLTTFMHIDEFKEKYPDATTTDFEQEEFRVSSCKRWFREDLVRIAEYWVKTPTMKTIGLMNDGTVIDITEDHDALDELKKQGKEVIKTRTMKSHKVQMYKMNGAEILEGPHEWAGRFIPIIPDFGEQITIENDRFTRGIVRFAKDANRVYNYIRSTEVETFALTPKDPFWVTQTQAEGYTQDYETFTAKNPTFMFFNSDPLNPGPPQRTGAPSVQSAAAQISAQSVDDVHATTSMYPPAMGNAPQLLSEKSVRSQAEKGDIGAYVYQANHEQSLQFTGEILVDLIPKIYDTPQMIQILGIDGKSETVPINTAELNELNETVLDEQTGQPIIVNNLQAGKYSIQIETGPAFSTQREESAQQLIELAQASPVFEQLVPDLIAKNLNIIESEEFVKRLRKYAIEQGIATPTEEEIEEMGLNQPQQPDPAEAALQENVEMQTASLQADIVKKDAEARQITIDTQSAAIKALETLNKAYKDKLEAGITLTAQENVNLAVQNQIVAESQEQVQQEQDKDAIVEENIES